jgi:hypothetical protein
MLSHKVPKTVVIQRQLRENTILYILFDIVYYKLFSFVKHTGLNLGKPSLKGNASFDSPPKYPNINLELKKCARVCSSRHPIKLTRVVLEQQEQPVPLLAGI